MAVFCYVVCLGFLDAKDRADMFEQATAEMASQALAQQKLTLFAQLRIGWGVMRPVVREREPRRWSWREALQRLIDVPMNAGRTALPIGIGTYIVLAVLGRPWLAVVAGLVGAVVALSARSIYSVRREIRILSGSATDAYAKEDAAIVTWANVVTLVRLLPLGVLVPILATRGSLGWSAAIFATVYATDALDGFVARRIEHRTTKIGSLLDPFVDRSVVLLGLAGLFLAPEDLPTPILVAAWCVAIRAGLALVLGSVLYLTDTSPRPNHSAHTASILEMVGVLTALFAAWRGDLSALAQGVVCVILFTAAVYGIISFWHYRTAISNGMVYGRGESFAVRIPPRALHAALTVLDGELHEPLRDELRRVARTNSDVARSVPHAIRKEIGLANFDLAAAVKEARLEKAGMLEERLRTLRAIQRELGSTQTRRFRADPRAAENLTSALDMFDPQLDADLREVCWELARNEPNGPIAKIVASEIERVRDEVILARDARRFTTAGELEERLQTLLVIEQRVGVPELRGADEDSRSRVRRMWSRVLGDWE